MSEEAAKFLFNAHAETGCREELTLTRSPSFRGIRVVHGRGEARREFRDGWTSQMVCSILEWLGDVHRYEAQRAVSEAVTGGPQ